MDRDHDRRRDDEPRTDERLDPGAYVGHEPELGSESIPGGVRADDERIAANASGASGDREALREARGEWPEGHREGAPADDDAVREAGRSG